MSPSRVLVKMIRLPSGETVASALYALSSVSLFSSVPLFSA
jgi:hypothetical protein